MNQETIDNIVQQEVSIGDFLKLKNQRPIRVFRRVGEYHVQDKEKRLYEIKNVEVYESLKLEIRYTK